MAVIQRGRSRRDTWALVSRVSRRATSARTNCFIARSSSGGCGTNRDLPSSRSAALINEYIGIYERARREFPARVTYGRVPGASPGVRRAFVRRLRLGIDYLRYLDPFYDTAPLRRMRARDRTPALLRLDVAIYRELLRQQGERAGTLGAGDDAAIGHHDHRAGEGGVDHLDRPGQRADEVLARDREQQRPPERVKLLHPSQELDRLGGLLAEVRARAEQDPLLFHAERARLPHARQLYQLNYLIRKRLLPDRQSAGEQWLPDGKGGYRNYPTQAAHELVISGENLQRFADVVGFSDTEKSMRLESALASYVRKQNRARFIATFASLEPDGTEDVYDVTVADVKTFDALSVVITRRS